VRNVNDVTGMKCEYMCTGGPGSRKGCIVDDLVMAYDLKHICTEQLLHSELPKKLAGVTKIENVNGVKEVLEVRNASDSHHKFSLKSRRMLLI